MWESLGGWLSSPGFGGAAAVAAASIAYAGVVRSVRSQREATRRQQWWERARWALDLTLSDDSTTRTIGLEVLDALGSSEFATEHEFDLVDAATAPTLEAYASSAAPRADRGAADADEAHLTLTTTDEGDGR